MSQVVSFEDFVPAARYDNIPWEQARIEEGAAITGPFTAIDTVTLTPLDADPAHPQSRSFTTANASDTPFLWYQVIFLDGSGDSTLPSLPIQNGVLRQYATTGELADLLHVNEANKRAQLERVLNAAAAEIDAEIGPVDSHGNPVPYTVTAPDLVVEVNLERATEHWQQMQSPFGLIGVAGETVPAFAVADTWQRHAHKLAPLKGSWGIA